MLSLRLRCPKRTAQHKHVIAKVSRSRFSVLILADIVRALDNKKVVTSCGRFGHRSERTPLSSRPGLPPDLPISSTCTRYIPKDQRMRLCRHRTIAHLYAVCTTTPSRRRDLQPIRCRAPALAVLTGCRHAGLAASHCVSRERATASGLFILRFPNFWASVHCGNVG